MFQTSLLLACLHFCFDMELIDKQLDLEAASRIHVMWWKPELWVRFSPRDRSVVVNQEAYLGKLSPLLSMTIQFYRSECRFTNLRLLVELPSSCLAKSLIMIEGATVDWTRLQ